MCPLAYWLALIFYTTTQVSQTDLSNHPIALHIPPIPLMVSFRF